jgi:hypothetical protein
MSKPPPDRGRDKNRQPEQAVNMVRGGAVCDTASVGKGAHLIRGMEHHVAVCLPTPGPDPRGRWRAAGQKPRPPHVSRSTRLMYKTRRV